MTLCSRCVSSATRRFSTNTGLETWGREEQTKKCSVRNVFAEAKDMAGEAGRYKDQCLLQKLASAQKHYANIQKLSIKRPAEHQTEQLLKPKQDRYSST